MSDLNIAVVNGGLGCGRLACWFRRFLEPEIGYNLRQTVQKGGSYISKQGKWIAQGNVEANGRKIVARAGRTVSL